MHKYQDAFLFEDNANVISVNENSLLEIVLDETIFYPGGGGQPCDTGFIRTDSFEGEVVEVADEGRIIHRVKPLWGTLKQGDKVSLSLDRERRLSLVRMHTGEHILFKSLQTVLGEITLDKINLDVDESSLFIFAKSVVWDSLFKAEELANKIIKEDRPVIHKEYNKEDAVVMQKLRIKPERIASDTVRVVEVEGFDFSACTGTHAASTGLVGNLLITKFGFVKGSWEIRFKANLKDEFFDYAKVARKAATILNTDIVNVIPSIERLKQEALEYKEKFRNLSFKFLDNYSEEKIGSITLITNIVEDIEKKQLVDKAASLIEEKTIVLFVNRAEGRATILISISPDLKINAPELLNRIISDIGGKGGGKDSSAMGSVDEKHADSIIEKAKHIIENFYI
jgi:alanyl-tRNA synthetase